MPLCLSCTDLDHLVYLPAGNAALTRRAKKASGLSAVVVRFSQSRRRYERQGILVEEGPLDRAERECLADEESRARRKLREQERRAEGDAELRVRAATEILRHYPGCPEDRAEEIANHAFTRGSGRIGRTAAGRERRSEPRSNRLWPTGGSHRPRAIDPPGFRVPSGQGAKASWPDSRAWTHQHNSATVTLHMATAVHPYAREASRVHDIAGLTDADIARATGAAPSTARAWLAGTRNPTGERADRLIELSALVERLQRVMDSSYIPVWLRRPIEALDDRKPLDLLARGDFRRVARVVSSLEDAPFT